jgi:hypothetical protein
MTAWTKITSNIRVQEAPSGAVGSENSPPAELSSEAFAALVVCILQAATEHASAGDALAATSKALGVQIGILAQRRGVPVEELVRATQRAVADFAAEASRQ